MVHSWNLYCQGMCTTSDGSIVARQGSEIIQMNQEGQTICQWEAPCSHTNLSNTFYICELNYCTKNGPYIANKCHTCEAVKIVNMKTGTMRKAYTSHGTEPQVICTGAMGTLLGYDKTKSSLIQLQWNEGDNLLHLIRKVKIQGGEVREICYLEPYRLVILSHKEPFMVQALELDTGHVVWQQQGMIQNKKFWPKSVCSDDHGWVYVADTGNNRIVKFNGATGDLVDISKGEGVIQDLSWLNNPGQLVVTYKRSAACVLYDMDRNYYI